MNRTAKTNLAILTAIFIALVLGCSDNDADGNKSTETADKVIPKAYLGAWAAADGSTVTIRSDASGDYKFGGKSVSGGSVEVDEAAKEIRFSFMGFDAGKYKIDEPPKGGRMKLDGIVYKKAGGPGDDEDPGKAELTVPGDAELRTLVYQTIREFSDAVRRGDFTDFSAASSKRLQADAPPAKLKEAFAKPIASKSDFAPKDKASLTFEPAPFIENGRFLNVTVKYPNAAGLVPTVQIDYLNEDGGWRVAGLEINPKNKGK